MATPRALRVLAGLPAVETLVRTLAGVIPGRRDSLAVLTFHRVASGPAVVPGLHSATPESFRRLLDRLAQSFRIISLQDVMTRASGGPALPRRSLLLTFDDGYADLAGEAWPALVERGIPAVAFIPTAFPQGTIGGFWWERAYAAIVASTTDVLHLDGRTLPLRTLEDRRATWRRLRDDFKRLPNAEVSGRLDALERALDIDSGNRPQPSGRSLTWPELVRLRDDGLVLASHTRTHPLLTQVGRPEAEAEVRGGIEDLEREIGPTPPAFAYPAGAHDASVVEIVRDAGIRLAFTTLPGTNDLGDVDWLRLRRFNVGVGTPPAAIIARALR
jgi:peptidoglycan/xylan/chitin deacetylase (PgdA/CDA1 family)